MAQFSWKDAPELMARLGKAQNSPANDMIDIMTFAGLCNSETELRHHVERYECSARNYVAPGRSKVARASGRSRRPFLIEA